MIRLLNQQTPNNRQSNLTPWTEGSESSELVSAETGSEDLHAAGSHPHWDGIPLELGRPGTRHGPDRIGPGGFGGPAAPGDMI